MLDMSLPDNPTEEGMDIVGFADYDSLGWSWKTQNSGAGKVAHIYGDPERFREDMERCHDRIDSYLKSFENRFLLSVSLPEHLMNHREW